MNVSLRKLESFLKKKRHERGILAREEVKALPRGAALACRVLQTLDLNLATLDWEVSVSRTQRNPEVGLVRGQGERLCSVNNI